jgi:hypothetical protein
MAATRRVTAILAARVVNSDGGQVKSLRQLPKAIGKHAVAFE